jgi:GNAT superfamily N-acetyltransferase
MRLRAAVEPYTELQMSLSSNEDLVLLTGSETRAQCGALAEILIACVNSGASVSFLAPLSPDKAEAFWRGVADSVEAGERLLAVAKERSSGRVIGTVQVLLKQPENQPHRADLAKMLVHPRARRRGVGAQLLRFAEEAALSANKTLLVLDTATGGDAERLYERSGWVRLGVIPDYALLPDGRPCSTTIFYKRL